MRNRPPTPFELQVYEAATLIPPGRTASYAWIARRVGCPSARAVAQSLRRNPFAPEVPCHRVVASDRKLRGYQGETSSSSLARKRSLLEAEGVEFDEAGRVAAHCFLDASENSKNVRA